MSDTEVMLPMPTPPEPTQPGWYRYCGKQSWSGSGPRYTPRFGSTMFLRTERGKWFAHFDNGDSGECAWGYIEQALGVFDLELVTALEWRPPVTPVAPDAELRLYVRDGDTVRLAATARGIHLDQLQQVANGISVGRGEETAIVSVIETNKGV